MLELLIVLTVVGLVVLWRQRVRLEQLEYSVRRVNSELVRVDQFDFLARRVAAIEVRLGPQVRTAPPPMPKPEPKPEPRPVQPPPIPIVIAKPVPAPALPPPLPPQFTMSTTPSLSERVRGWLGNEEWESLVGGSIVNKLGAVILVIGIALFLGYQLAHVGPAGRAAICITVSAGLLGAGVMAERRPRLNIFSRGLIGAGWAALYATAYAVYAIPEARLIQDPVIGSLGVLAVACGMIGHSMKYRVQAITGVAYFAAFAAIAITPAVPFAAVSLIPLAASLLYLASRYGWYEMAAFGAAATYATCLIKGDPNGTLAGAQVVLLGYWLMFEVYDLMRTAGPAQAIFPINAIGFLGVSYLTWAHLAPDQLWIASAWGAALYVGSAIVRAVYRGKSGFEVPTLIAVALAAMAILGGSPRVWSSFAFAVEAEVIFGAGVVFGSTFLRRVGGGFFVVSLAAIDQPVWSSSALFHAFLFSVNRAMLRSGVAFSAAAATLVALVMATELTALNAALGWTVLGIALLELGLYSKQREFLLEGAALAVAGPLWAVIVHVYSAPQPWQPLAVCVALVYGFTLQTRKDERPVFQNIGACLTAVTSAALLWRLVPPVQLGIAWCVLTVVLLELGLRHLPSVLRHSLLPMTAACTVAIVVTHPATWPTYLVATLCGVVAVIRRRENAVAVAAAAAFVAYLWLALPAALFTLVLIGVAIALLEVRDFPFLKWVTLGYALVALACLCVFDIPVRPMVALAAIAGLYGLRVRLRELEPILMWVALIPLVYLPYSQFYDHAALWWAVAAVLLLVARFRLDGYLLCGLSAAFALALNTIPAQLAISIPVVGLLYAAYVVTRKDILCIVATFLLSAVLYGGVSGGMLTVAWGTLGLAVLGLGFLLVNRVLRWQGLVLLLVCILKLFLYDLRNLETPYRILSFIVLGLILLGVSWIYTGFRDQVRRIIS